MEYVIAAVLVLLLIGGFVTFLVLNATRKSGPAARGEGVPGIGQDATPLGDTSEHAGTHSEQGATVEDPESQSPARTDPDEAAHVARPGEGEGREQLEFEGRRPASERLADRER
jgi:hypothetical protein